MGQAESGELSLNSHTEIQHSNTHADRDEVFERLAHFEACDVKMSRMYEIINPLAAVVVGLLEMCQVCSDNERPLICQHPPPTVRFRYHDEGTSSPHLQSGYPCSRRGSRWP